MFTFCFYIIEIHRNMYFLVTWNVDNILNKIYDTKIASWIIFITCWLHAELSWINDIDSTHYNFDICEPMTMPAPHHSVFYRPDALTATQPTASKHWRDLLLQECATKRWCIFISYNLCLCTTWGNMKPWICHFSLKCCMLLYQQTCKV